MIDMALSYGKSRHFRRRHNIIKQLLSNDIISINYIKSKANKVNPFNQKFEWRVCKLLIEGNGFKAFYLSPIMVTLSG